MSDSQITPHKITQPFQLMAAWFVMLILLEGLFVTAAIKIENPSWIPAMFSIAAVSAPVVVFISVFLMQTVFRPHLQEGDYYFKWLKDQQEYRKVSITQVKTPMMEARSEVVVEELQNVTSAVKQLQQVQIKTTDLLSAKLGDGSNLDLQELRKLNEKLTEQLGDEVSRLSGLRKSSSFPVEVVDIDGGRELVELLRNAGFNATTHEELFDDGPKNPNDHAAVWVGKHVPWDVVKDVVLSSRNIWPHLKYLHLSGREGAPDYINYELFVGGATKSATGMFNCQPWNDEDFRKLKDLNSQQALHDLILRKMG